MPYVSKHYTCEEIDQRLYQGYYDDFLKAGFSGTIQEFWAFVLSIKDKADNNQVNLLLKELEDKVSGNITGVSEDLSSKIEELNTSLSQTETQLNEKIDTGLEEANQNLTTEIQGVNDRIDQEVSDIKDIINTNQSNIPTKVSQLENDLKFQTKEEVEAYINKLVNGADEALDTLLELSNALNNDPNFATNITKLLSQLQVDLNAEVSRAKEAEADLQAKIDTEIAKRETGDNEIRELLEVKYTSLTDALQEAVNQLDTKIDIINDRFLSIQGTLDEFKTSVQDQVDQFNTDLNTRIDDLTDELHTSKQDLEDSISTNREEVETLIQDSSDSINQTITSVRDDLNSTKEELSQRIIDESDRAKEQEKNLIDKVADLRIEVTDKNTELSNRITQTASAVDIEATTRRSEDDKLRSSLQEEIVNRTADKTSILSKLSDEINSRTQADSELRIKIEQEAQVRTQVDTAINTDLTLKYNELKTSISSLDQKVDSNDQSLQNSIDSLSTSLSNEVSRAKEAENNKVDKKEGYGLSKNDLTDALLDKLNNISEFANRVTRTSELINDSGFQTSEQVNAAIESLINAAPDTLNTLKELADALGNDPNFATTLTTKISQLGVQLNQEIADRQKQKEDITQAYTQAIANEATRVNAALSNLQTSLEAYKGTVQSNFTSVSEEITRIKNDISSLETDINQDITDLESDINTVNTSLTQSFNTLKTSVESSVIGQDAKINKNTEAIQKNLDLIQDLQKQYQEHGNDLQESLKIESDIRKAKDDALDARIDEANQVILKEIADRTSEISRLESVISNGNTESQANIDKLRADLDAEINRAKAEESRLDQKIDENLNTPIPEADINSMINALNPPQE